MKSRFLVILIAAVALLIVACGQDNSPTSDNQAVDGASLLGLQNNDTLVYLQTDTNVYIDSTYHYDVTEEYVQIAVTGSGNDWIFRRDAEPGLNIKLGTQSVLLSGYRRQDDTVEVVTNFAEPPALLHRDMVVGDSWTGYTPSYTSPTGPLLLPLYFANFGFHFKRTYVGPESISVPKGEYDAYRYESDLYINAGDSIPVAHVVEDYVRNVGLARVQFRGGGLIRTLSLSDPN